MSLLTVEAGVVEDIDDEIVENRDDRTREVPWMRPAPRRTPTLSTGCRGALRVGTGFDPADRYLLSHGIAGHVRWGQKASRAVQQESDYPRELANALDELVS
jgi:hypothetical protein